jgi:hypothetical protein
VVDRKADPYNLDLGFERCVAVVMSRSLKFYGYVGQSIELDALGDATCRLIVRAAQTIGRDLGRGPTSSTTVSQCIRRWVDEGSVTFEEYTAAANLLSIESRDLPSEQEVIAALSPIVKRRMEAALMRTAFDEYGKRNGMARTAKLLDTIERVGVKATSLGRRLGLASFDEIAKLRHLDKLPMPVADLDIVMSPDGGLTGGGLPRGNVGCVCAPYGGGKSSFLTHLGSKAFRAGMFVGLVTLELAPAVQEARFIAALTGEPANAIIDGTSLEARDRLEELLPECGVLLTEEFPALHTTAADVHRWVIDVESDVGRPMDLLLIDYVNNMAGDTVERENTNSILKRTTVAIRQMAHDKQMWVWLAAQAGRRQRGERKHRVDGDDVSGGISIPQTVAQFVTMTLNDDASLVELYVAKNSFGRSRCSVKDLPTDFAHGRVTAV